MESGDKASGLRSASEGRSSHRGGVGDLKGNGVNLLVGGFMPAVWRATPSSKGPLQKGRQGGSGGEPAAGEGPERRRVVEAHSLTPWLQFPRARNKPAPFREGGIDCLGRG